MAFIPGDQLLSAAYESDPTLQEHAMANNGLLTTPTMLIALLRTAAAFGWRQENRWPRKRTRGAEAPRELSLYDRLRTMSTHLQRLQRSLTASVSAYNDAVGSLESRVLVSARRFPSLGGGGSRRIRPVTSPISQCRSTRRPASCKPWSWSSTTRTVSLPSPSHWQRVIPRRLRDVAGRALSVWGAPALREAGWVDRRSKRDDPLVPVHGRLPAGDGRPGRPTVAGVACLGERTSRCSQRVLRDYGRPPHGRSTKALSSDAGRLLTDADLALR